jgi:GntR family transcriptional regulator / MocR family aminotransferase
VMPPELVEPLRHAKLHLDRQTDRIQQHAFADFLTRGELDRHLRRMRASYRRRRDVLVETLAEELPDATVRGIAAGLHVTVVLRATDDEQAVLEEVARRRIALDTMSNNRTGAAGGPPILLLGCGQVPEASVRPGIRELAAAVRAARTR